MVAGVPISNLGLEWVPEVAVHASGDSSHGAPQRAGFSVAAPLRDMRARAPGIEPMTKKGLRDRNSPTCTLSQNGYGDILGQGLRLPLWPGGVTCMTRPATHKVVRAFGCGFRIKRCFRRLCIHLRLQQLHILL